MKEYINKNDINQVLFEYGIDLNARPIFSRIQRLPVVTEVDIKAHVIEEIKDTMMNCRYDTCNLEKRRLEHNIRAELIDYLEKELKQQSV